MGVPQPVSPGETSNRLPCSAEGFYQHPTDCSRFYRCVDYVGTGTVFSTYEFRCPLGNVFITQGKDTCVPGACGDDGIAQPAMMPFSQPEVQSTTMGQEQAGSGDSGGSAMGESGSSGQDMGSQSGSLGSGQQGSQNPVTYPPEVIPSQQGGDSGSTVANNQVTGSESSGMDQSTNVEQPVSEQSSVAQPPAVTYPPVVVPSETGDTASSQSGSMGQTENSAGSESGGMGQTGSETTPSDVVPESSGSIQGGGAYPQPGGSQSVGDEESGQETPVVECPNKYVQDDTYCNVYRACPDDGQSYTCAHGSVFNQNQQLCDLAAAAPALYCGNKPMKEHSFREITPEEAEQAQAFLNALSLAGFPDQSGLTSAFSAPVNPVQTVRQNSYWPYVNQVVPAQIPAMPMVYPQYYTTL